MYDTVILITSILVTTYLLEYLYARMTLPYLLDYLTYYNVLCLALCIIAIFIFILIIYYFGLPITYYLLISAPFFLTHVVFSSVAVRLIL